MRSYEAERRRRSPWRNWYKLAIWQANRRAVLARDVWCVRCRRAGRCEPATTVNHVVPHRGDWSRFVDPENLEGVCKRCHDGAIQAEERRGFSTACGADGWPLDPRHPANRG